MDPCFIYYHIFMQKLFFVASKQLQTTLWIVDALLFFNDCEQILHPLWTQLSHWQMFMQNGEYTAFWYLPLLCYLTQLQFTIGQNEFVEFFVFFFCVFRDNRRIWATWTFSIIFVCTTVFKVSIPLLNRWFWRGRVRITLIKPLHCLNSIFPIRKQCLLNTRNSDFPLFWKFATVASLK